MKKSVIFILFFVSIYSFGQNEKFIQGKEFNSIFQNLKDGNFTGTINGLLILTKENKEFYLDFQGSEAKLNIEHDENEMYDVSFKNYSGSTTSGKTKIVYKNYAYANSIKIYIYNSIFELSGIDGASDMVINGIDYEYKLENNFEYLILNFKKRIELTNYRFLLNNHEHSSKSEVKELQAKTEKIYIEPNSALVFIINR